jgi:hypothetical protein
MATGELSLHPKRMLRLARPYFPGKLENGTEDGFVMSPADFTKLSSPYRQGRRLEIDGHNVVLSSGADNTLHKLVTHAHYQKATEAHPPMVFPASFEGFLQSLKLHREPRSVRVKLVK